MYALYAQIFVKLPTVSAQSVSGKYTRPGQKQPRAVPENIISICIKQADSS